MVINYDYLLNVKYKNAFLMIIVLIITLIIIILSCTLLTYDTYLTSGIYRNKTLSVYIPINNSDAVIKGEFIKIDKKNYSYNINAISEIEENNYINYQAYEIETVNTNFLENEVVNITFYYNKEKIIQKIINIIF